MERDGGEDVWWGGFVSRVWPQDLLSPRGGKLSRCESLTECKILPVAMTIPIKN